MNRLPSLFVSHGAPTFAIEPGLAGSRLTALGRALPRPRAVLVVSPQWMTPNPRVGLAARPQTIHGFGGFDPALYDIVYPVDGHPALAQRALALLDDAGWAPQADERRTPAARTPPPSTSCRCWWLPARRLRRCRRR